jgi:hypothetical protein
MKTLLFQLMDCYYLDIIVGNSTLLKNKHIMPNRFVWFIFNLRRKKRGKLGIHEIIHLHDYTCTRIVKCNILELLEHCQCCCEAVHLVPVPVLANYIALFCR